MSGLEAAGLILGLWPVVASLVKGYKATKSGEDCAAFLRDLKVQETVYKGCIRRLLQENEVFSNEEFISIEDENAEISPWRDSLFQMHLKNRIGTENFTSIDDVLCSIDSTLKELKRQLQNGEADLALDRGRRARFRSTFRHIKMNLPQSGFQKTFAKLKDGNATLQQLVQLFEEPRVLPSRKRASSRPRRGSNTRRQRRVGPRPINELSQAIEECYHCNCINGHEASFWVSGDDQFRILFTIENPERSLSDFSLKTRPTLETEASTIHAEEESVPGSPVEDPGIELPETPSGDRFATSPSRDDDQTCWSRSRPSTPSTRSQDRQTLPLHFSPRFPGTNAGLRQIEDMCTLIKKLSQASTEPTGPRSSVGTLGRGDMHFTALSTEAVAAMTSNSVVSLDDRLPQSDEWLLSLQKRVDIAQKLALAIVQFWSTEWIGRLWTWRDFSLKDDNPRDLQLFVTRTIFPRIPETKQPVVQAKLWRFLREPLLVRLGFALIELALGKRLSRLREDGKFDRNYDYEFGQDAMDYDTAMDILERNIIEEEVGVAYQSVVAACLSCQVIQETGAVSLTTAASSFQDDVERFIVQPLYEYFETTWGIPV